MTLILAAALPAAACSGGGAGGDGSGGNGAVGGERDGGAGSGGRGAGGSGMGGVGVGGRGSGGAGLGGAGSGGNNGAGGRGAGGSATGGAGLGGSGAGGAGTGGRGTAAGGATGAGGAGSGGRGAGAGGATGAGGSGAGGQGMTATGPCAPPAGLFDVSNPTTVVGTGAGTCTEAALTAAIAKGGVITFDCGGAATITVTSPKTITAMTVIDGGGNITLSGGGTTRLFVAKSNADFAVQRITLADAFVNGARGSGPSDANSGAAIYRQSNAKLTVIGVTFTNNQATLAGGDVGGGAVFSYGGDTVIVGSTFTGNSGASGGAVGNLRSNLTIVNSTFTGNHAVAGNGGAVSLDGQNADHGKVFTVCGATITANHANREGGAIYRYGYPGESSVIDMSTFDGNFADDAAQGLGGGLYVITDTPGAMPLTLTNSTISNNSAGFGGGGLVVNNAPIALTNVTVAGNIARASLAGGISASGVTGTLLNCTIAGNHADAAAAFGGGIIGGAALTLTNTIVASNTAGNAYNPVSCTDLSLGDHDLQFPATRAGGGSDNPCVTSIAFADPLLGPLQDNGGPTRTMAPAAQSPAIGAGAGCPATDQRGRPRTGRCDLGAVQSDN
jgi:hypothetical protein